MLVCWRVCRELHLCLSNKIIIQKTLSNKGYDLTESTAVGSRGFNVIGKTHKYTSVGLLAPNMEAKVVNCSTGLCVAPGKPGELLLRGPGVMKEWRQRDSSSDNVTACSSTHSLQQAANSHPAQTAAAPT